MITEQQLDVFFNQLPPETLVHCALAFRNPQHTIPISHVRPSCLRNCGVRIECYREKKDVIR